jgi:hypothetical protein
MIHLHTVKTVGKCPTKLGTSVNRGPGYKVFEKEPVIDLLLATYATVCFIFSLSNSGLLLKQMTGCYAVLESGVPYRLKVTLLLSWIHPTIF